MKTALRLAALALVALPLFTGCAASGAEDEDAGEAGEAVRASSPVTLANFAFHPKIEEVNDIVAAVDAALGTYRHESKAHLCNDEVGENTRDLYSQGAVGRRLVLGSFSDLSTSATTLTYDARGTLRSVVTYARDAFGYGRETRSFLDAQGKLLFSVERAARGDSETRPDLDAARSTLPIAPVDLSRERTTGKVRFAAAPVCG